MTASESQISIKTLSREIKNSKTFQGSLRDQKKEFQMPHA